MLCKFLLQERMTIFGTHAYTTWFRNWMLYLYLPCVITITWLILSIKRPFIYPHAHSVLALLLSLIILVVNTAFVTIALPSLLLSCHCCYSNTVATNKFCQASISSGVIELITHLLSLIFFFDSPCVELINLDWNASFENCCDPLPLVVIINPVPSASCCFLLFLYFRKSLK